LQRVGVAGSAFRDQHAAHAAYASAQRVAYRQAQLDIDADVAAAVQSGMVL